MYGEAQAARRSLKQVGAIQHSLHAVQWALSVLCALSIVGILNTGTVCPQSVGTLSTVCTQYSRYWVQCARSTVGTGYSVQAAQWS